MTTDAMDRREPRTAAGRRMYSAFVNGAFEHKVSRIDPANGLPLGFSYILAVEAEAAEQARRASGEREAALREALLSVRTTDQGIRDALAALGKPGTLAEAIVFSVAGAFLDARALLAADTPAREPGIDVERLARAIAAVQAPINKRRQGTGNTAVKIKAGTIGARKRWGEPGRRLALAVAAEYARLAASDTATEDER